MPVGKYAGIPVDQIPNSYLRWMITQRFPKEILLAVETKLKKSDFDNTFIQTSRHAIDMYSKRFLFRWLKKENIRGEEGEGIATHLAKAAQEAWEKGTDVSKNRHVDDGTVKLYDGVLWVFKVNLDFPDYKDLVTVMES